MFHSLRKRFNKQKEQLEEPAVGEEVNPMPAKKQKIDWKSVFKRYVHGERINDLAEELGVEPQVVVEKVEEQHGRENKKKGN